MSIRTTLERLALLAAVVGEGLVLYFGPEPLLRLIVGLLLLAVIVWAAARVGLVEILGQSPPETIHKRRFGLLRAQVQQLLAEIRRLNVERGFRTRDRALSEMDAIEARLRSLIAEIRSTAGQMSDESEVVK
jgi:disulfide bond formation protein DsbB